MLKTASGSNPAGVQCYFLSVRPGLMGGHCISVEACDPWVDAAEAKHESGLGLTTPGIGECDAIIMALGCDDFRNLGAAGIRARGKLRAVLYDVKYVLQRESMDGRL